MAWLWWLGGALVLGVVEMLTVDLIFLMFAGGALAAGGVAMLGAPLWAQILTFAVVSAVLLVAVRPWALGYLKRSTPDTLTNVAAHVGRSAEVLVDVTDRAGRVKLAGEVWTARAAEPGSLLPTGTTVQVVRIDGATAVVAPLPVTYPEGAL
ncbi:NfeD family protein [Georgenia phoenicis]|uniref:NfeD family protein n=1 Tax=unclassified Georgenia TaxID=2626815 RepID=UPI0039AFFFBA